VVQVLVPVLVQVLVQVLAQVLAQVLVQVLAQVLVQVLVQVLSRGIMEHGSKPTHYRLRTRDHLYHYLGYGRSSLLSWHQGTL
jgi:hypothetical protein